MRKYLLLLIGCTTIGLVFFTFIHYSETGAIPTFRLQSEKYMVAILITNALGFVIFQIDRLLDKIIHWKSNFLLRFISGLGANILLIILFFAFIGKHIFEINGEAPIKLTMLFIISIFIYEIFYGLFYSYRHYAVTQAEQLRSERWQLELQFESLKSQISPHYLFNCLNTVSSLLYKDTRVAEEFIRRMADTFRYVLNHQTQKLVPLREELEFVKSYYFLLQVRYEYHLQLEINVPQNILDSMIPPMTLQLLVENAVKHNSISKDQPLLVYISAVDNTSLIIYNTKTSSLKPVTSFRVGLENIHKRYSFFTHEKVIVRDDEKFLVQLPVLKKNLAL
ncbi:MAG: histidine kinase [Cyclobacteriaceae bacterium]|nr:histidine kinase [Cyclobacteriaceae bacterium]